VRSRLLTIIPINLNEANDFVRKHHRHHRPTVGHKFSVAVTDGKSVRGVAICGRPVARSLDDGLTLEVLRVCTDGVRNGCSKLYGACRKAGHALGYQQVITYTLASESGSSLRAAGWRKDGEVNGRSWDCPSRPRQTELIADKVRWICLPASH
jgi:hypothetical protein